jgi:hypothetical protein
MNAVLYTWGEFEKTEDIMANDLKGMRKLTKQELLSFVYRKEDKNKTFYASEDYIDSGADGIAVKFAYAVDARDELVLKP